MLLRLLLWLLAGDCNEVESSISGSSGRRYLRRSGYKVVGDKFGKDGLGADDAVFTIRRDLGAGASKVAIENNELVGYMRNNDRTTLARIIDEVGLASLLFEIGGGGVANPEIAAWLLREFGPDLSQRAADPHYVIVTSVNIITNYKKRKGSTLYLVAQCDDCTRSRSGQSSCASMRMI